MAEQYENFDEWWKEKGKGIKPGIYDDMETHARRVAIESWNAAIHALAAAIKLKVGSGESQCTE